MSRPEQNGMRSCSRRRAVRSLKAVNPNRKTARAQYGPGAHKKALPLTARQSLFQISRQLLVFHQLHHGLVERLHQAAVFVEHHDHIRLAVFGRCDRQRPHMPQDDILFPVRKAEQALGVLQRAPRMRQPVKIIARFLCVEVPVVQKKVVQQPGAGGGAGLPSMVPAIQVAEIRNIDAVAQARGLAVLGVRLHGTHQRMFQNILYQSQVFRISGYRDGAHGFLAAVNHF